MSLDGKFEWVASRRKGGMRSISFVISNSNLLTSETFSAVIINAANGQAGIGWNDIKLERGKSLRFDYDSVDWDWCQGDTFAIVDSKGKIKKHWTLQIPVARPGECSECHGTHRCSACRGSGVIPDRTYRDRYERCARCFGTGICQSCYVPVRTLPSQHPDPYSPVQDDQMRHSSKRKADAIRARIRELEAQLERAEWDIRMYQLKDMDVANRTSYSAQLQYKTQLSMQIDKLRYQLQSLESLQ